MKEVIIKSAESASSSIITKAINSLWKVVKLSYKEYMIPTPEHFIHYTLTCYESFSKVKCLAKNQAIMPLEQIYVPLTLIKASDSETTYKVDRFDDVFFHRYKQLLIVDTAGMGKSTLVKKLFMDIVDSGNLIPIFIELRRLNKSHSIIEEIQSQVSKLKEQIMPELLYYFIQEGKFIFILDGYDEIPLSDKKEVTTSLQDFINRSSSNNFIITSRQEIALASFDTFETFRIQPLKREEAFLLLQKYDNADKECSKLLISELKRTRDFDDFLGNPLLVSMLLTAFSYKNEIPREKHLFYRNVFDAYYNRHDMTKGGAYQHEKHSGLGSELFHRLLRYTGLLCLKKGKIEFTKDQLIDTLEQALQYCPDIKCSAGDFFEDILEVVPLFVQDGIYYRWSHKSLYEYFAAQSISRDIPKKDQVLIRLASEGGMDKYYNLLDLFYDMDYVSFRRSIINHFLEEFVSFVELSADNSVNEIRRRQLLFNRNEYYIVFITKDADKDKRVPAAVSSMYSKYKFNSFYLYRNEDDTLFVFRQGNNTRNELLIKLLIDKGFPVIVKSQRDVSLATNVFTPYKVNSVNTSSDDPDIDSASKQAETNILNDLVDHIDYQRAKEQLVKIADETKAAISFTDDLLS